MIQTWHVWSILPPECHEEVSASSMLDAACAWARRVFHKGLLPRNGHEVIVCGANDPNPRMSAYRVKITIPNAPAFQASFAGLAYEGLNDDPNRGDRNG
jgi:hypothetical protein